MGQKTNPNIIRLGVATEWNSKYIEKKPTESSTLIFKNLEIQKYLSQLFIQNELHIENTKISYSEDSLYVFVSFYNLRRNLFFSSDQQKIKLGARKAKSFSFKKRITTLHKTILKKELYMTKTYGKTNNFYAKQALLKKKYILEDRTHRLQPLKSLKSHLDDQSYKTLNKQNLNSFSAKVVKGLSLFIGKQKSVFLSLKQINREFDILQQTPKKTKKIIEQSFTSLRKFQQNEFFTKGFNILYNFVKNNQNPKFLAEIISFYLTKLKRPNFFLRFLKLSLKTLIKTQSVKVQRIQIKIKGRFNGAPRSSHKFINIGNNIPVLTLSSKINYGDSTAYTLNGTFGVKVWVYTKIIDHV
jgi:ribosomal protein S3